MSEDMERIAKDLADLGARIDAKIAEFNAQGVLHGPTRVAAADLKMRHERAAIRAASGNTTTAGEIADDLAADLQILKDGFEWWLASIDRASERPKT